MRSRILLGLLISTASLVSLAGPPARAAKKYGSIKPGSADPAAQTKALTIFMNVAGDWCALEGASFSFPIYSFDADQNQYVPAASKFSSCSDFPPSFLLDGLTSAIVLSTNMVPNYDTAHESNGVQYRYSPFNEEADKASQTLLGKPLIAKRIKEKNGGDFVNYNPEAFQAAFDRFYIKPSETRGGVLAQRLYDAVFKTAIAHKVEVIARVMDKKQAFLDQTKTMTDKIQNDESFYGGDFAYRAAVEIGGGKGDVGQPYVDSGFLGSMMRRQADGTLPVILNSLKIVLRDYDPATFKKYGSKL